MTSSGNHIKHVIKKLKITIYYTFEITPEATITSTVHMDIHNVIIVK